MLPTDADARKKLPIFTGVLMYFPDAIAAVAEVSRLGNEQHNPGEPLHWAREKSTDQMNTAIRHMVDHGQGNVKDTDGTYHLAKAVWRLLAELQLTIENRSTVAVVLAPEDTDYPVGGGDRKSGCCGHDGEFWNCERPAGHTGVHKAWRTHPRRDPRVNSKSVSVRLYEHGEWA